MRRTDGFTLVELLVVIGIIAILVAVLLPALRAARKQAAAIKCATALREIGNAMQMYAMENKGYFPCAQVQMLPGHVYNVDGVDYPRPGSGLGAYWFTFLAKYVTKSKTGLAAENAGDVGDARRTIFWGCPEWDGYRNPIYNNLGGIHPVQLGFGMNHLPTFTESYPAPGSSLPTAESTFIQRWSRNPASQLGNWQKQNIYGRNGSRRALVMDSQFWLAEALAPPANGVIPGQKIYDPGPVTYSLSGQTLADFYRHGRFPPVRVGGPSGYYNTMGGKVAYNILYCDGHVSTTNDRVEAYRSLRMRFPG